ncbi:GM10790 [Drosophila sechellia]|uniref:GM10790 n=1 Tax=Drosophila sechellia TaxID=7238 RepID=B4I3W3_DROSE|nr:GM10790 [Drosophila sechellia]
MWHTSSSFSSKPPRSEKFRSSCSNYSVTLNHNYAGRQDDRKISEQSDQDQATTQQLNHQMIEQDYSHRKGGGALELVLQKGQLFHPLEPHALRVLAPPWADRMTFCPDPTPVL